MFVAVLAVVFSGCATTEQQARWRKFEEQRKGREEYPYLPTTVATDPTIDPYKKELDARTKMAKDAEERARQALAAKEESDWRAREAMMALEKAKKEALLPPSTAKPGECYARVYVPPRYQTITERVLVRQASEKIETVPAKFEMVEEKSL